MKYKINKLITAALLVTIVLGVTLTYQFNRERETGYSLLSVQDCQNTFSGEINYDAIQKRISNIPFSVCYADAVSNGYVVLARDSSTYKDLIVNRDVLKNFIAAANSGMESSVRIVTCNTNQPDSPIINVIDLFYNREYYFGVMDDNRVGTANGTHEPQKLKFKKLNEFDTGQSYIVCLSDDTLTEKEYWNRMVSSDLNKFLSVKLLFSLKK